MTSAHPPVINRFCLDAWLVAAVQARAGARVHESAGLLNAYRLSAECGRLMARKGDARAADEARQSFEESETRLRRFLVGCVTASRVASMTC